MGQAQEVSFFFILCLFINNKRYCITNQMCAEINKMNIRYISRMLAVSYCSMSTTQYCMKASYSAILALVLFDPGEK